MARPMRIEFENAFYHVMSRGNHQETIFENDQDHERFIELLGEVCNRFQWRIWARCEMSNHFHLLVQTLEPTLSRGMRHLKGVYTQWSNARHAQVGHLFQARYKAILVDADSYLTEVIRYIVRNPLEAKMIESLDEYEWSSHPMTLSRKKPPEWFARAQVLELFGSNTRTAKRAYRSFVEEAALDIVEASRQQLFLGDEGFIAKMKALKEDSESTELSSEYIKAQRRRLVTIAELGNSLDRDELIRRAYGEGFPLKEIGDYVGLHYSSVCRIGRAE